MSLLLAVTLGTAIVLWVTWRREFASGIRRHPSI